MTANYSLERFSTARFAVKEAWEAKWARRMALFFLQLLILTVLLHRFAGLGTPAAINLIAVSVAALFIAMVIALISLIRIWFGGQSGASEDFAAIFVALLGLALPAYFLSKAVLLPPLTDVQTSPADALQFTALANERPRDANLLVNPDAEKSELQAEAYPDIGPMFLERSAPEVFAIVNEAVSRLGWTVLVNETPGESGLGRIEATDQSLIMAFTDDVVIGVKGDDAHTLIDVRSASRYGMHDFGANADRIRKLYAEINTTLEKGEKTVLEQAAPKDAEEPVAKPVEPARKKTKRSVRKRR
ncbi:MAG: DUF1499 domain-containing protein [Methyloceanibacter sp.]|uniref:DUF1499 domain-containing protein n=1 Tax=Methyloceanibacter sp. TaxID=1965321 RepID=UPI003D6D0FBC